jgi:hypothetical protein
MARNDDTGENVILAFPGVESSPHTREIRLVSLGFQCRGLSAELFTHLSSASLVIGGLVTNRDKYSIHFRFITDKSDTQDSSIVLSRGSRERNPTK